MHAISDKGVYNAGHTINFTLLNLKQKKLIYHFTPTLRNFSSFIPLTFFFHVEPVFFLNII